MSRMSEIAAARDEAERFAGLDGRMGESSPVAPGGDDTGPDDGGLAPPAHTSPLDAFSAYVSGYLDALDNPPRLADGYERRRAIAEGNASAYVTTRLTLRGRRALPHDWLMPRKGDAADLICRCKQRAPNVACPCASPQTPPHTEGE